MTNKPSEMGTPNRWNGEPNRNVSQMNQMSPGMSAATSINAYSSLAKPIGVQDNTIKNGKLAGAGMKVIHGG